MNKNDYDRDKCLDYFQAYRDCKKAWVSGVQKQFVVTLLWLMRAL